MNVYVRELVSSLAQTGVDSTVFVRRHNDAPAVVDVEPGFRVVHVPAGPVELAKESLEGVVAAYADAVSSWLATNPVDVIHANYWLSGVAGHRLKHEHGLPLVSTFHTLARVKADAGDSEPRRRGDAEAEIVACSDVITANSVAEVQQLARFYGADPTRINVVAPGVDPAVFSVGSQAGAREALGIGTEPVLLFVGRIQPLKGLDLAVQALGGLGARYRDARLLVVGGASGTEGEAELRRVEATVRRLGLESRVTMVSPKPHHLLATYYRAADVCVVPSRSESFGLVALEASACAVPVVAADVGGLRTLVDHGRNGLLVSQRDPRRYSSAIETILDDPDLAASMGRCGAEMAARYSWTATADRLRREFGELISRVPLDCTVA